MNQKAKASAPASPLKSGIWPHTAAPAPFPKACTSLPHLGHPVPPLHSLGMTRVLSPFFFFSYCTSSGENYSGCVCVHAQACTCVHTCIRVVYVCHNESQKNCRNQFLLSTIRILESELILSDLVASTFTCWAITMVPQNVPILQSLFLPQR